VTRPDIVCRKCSQPAVGFHVLAIPYDPKGGGAQTKLAPTCDDHAYRRDRQVLPIDTWWCTYVVEDVMKS
jgi:hypothetical protein